MMMIISSPLCVCVRSNASFFRLVTKMPSKSLLTTSSLLHPPLEMETDHLMCPTAVATSTTTTITTTILSITPATSIESTLSRVQDGQLSSRNQPSQMSKAHQFSTAAAVQGQQPKIFMVKNHQISTPPPQIKEPDTSSSSHESTKPISQKTDFHSNQLRSNSNSTISKTTSTLSDSDSKKDFKDEPSKFDPPATNDAPASKNTPIFHQRQFPLGIPIADTMVCPFVVTIANPRRPNSTSTKNGLSPVARISSSSSKVSDV